MDAVEILLLIAQGLLALLLGVGGWVLRRGLDDVERTREATRLLSERMIRAESRIDQAGESGVRVEAKLDRLFNELREVRERLAAWDGHARER